MIDGRCTFSNIGDRYGLAADPVDVKQRRLDGAHDEACAEDKRENAGTDDRQRDAVTGRSNVVRGQPMKGKGTVRATATVATAPRNRAFSRIEDEASRLSCMVIPGM